MALPTPSPHGTCLVTGASSGIGADLARELAGRGLGVTLVARREDRLRELADELSSRHRIRAEVAGCDLGDAQARAGLVAELDGRGLEVEVLVNNAGFGWQGRFVEQDRERAMQMVQLNVDALTDLCAHYAPRMAARGRGAILNLGSTVAFQPLPAYAVYAASKAYVLSFTESLHTELAGSGVTVSVLCPGLTRSEFHAVAEQEEAMSGVPDVAWQDSAEVARGGIEGLVAGKRVILTSAINRAQSLGGRFTPHTVLLPLLRRGLLSRSSG